MGKIFILLTFLGNTSSQTTNPIQRSESEMRASMESDQQTQSNIGISFNKISNAANETRRALMQDKDTQEDVKLTTNRVENWATTHTGLSKDELVYAAYGAPLITRQISTKPFTNFKFKVWKFTVRPEIDYRFNGDAEKFRAVAVFLGDF